MNAVWGRLDERLKGRQLLGGGDASPLELDNSCTRGPQRLQRLPDHHSAHHLCSKLGSHGHSEAILNKDRPRVIYIQ